MHERSIELLNKAVADELCAVHQYMYFHFRLDDLGYARLAGLLRRIAVEEMLHVERLAERILYLGGEVEMEVAEPVRKIHDAKAMLERAREMERQSQKDYNRWAVECGQQADAASRKVFEGLVEDEERHDDLFDRQIRHIERFGERYLALQGFEEPAGPESG